MSSLSFKDFARHSFGWPNILVYPVWGLDKKDAGWGNIALGWGRRHCKCMYTGMLAEPQWFFWRVHDCKDLWETIIDLRPTSGGPSSLLQLCELSNVAVTSLWQFVGENIKEERGVEKTREGLVQAGHVSRFVNTALRFSDCHSYEQWAVLTEQTEQTYCNMLRWKMLTNIQQKKRREVLKKVWVTLVTFLHLRTLIDSCHSYGPTHITRIGGFFSQSHCLQVLSMIKINHLASSIIICTITMLIMMIILIMINMMIATTMLMISATLCAKGRSVLSVPR